ncbi:MAG: RNA polymerase sigma factor [Bacteriovoracaceae bacterium]|nr:RNA polymerase sigma factor [Bacteriovoracaceae bacterium]
MREERFNQINNEFSKALKRICASYEHNEQKSLELYQDVMMAIWQSLPNFKDESTLKTWVYRIAYNKSITHVSKEAKSNKLEFNSLEDLEVSVESNQVENQDQLKVIQGILMKLDPIDREVFVLYLEGEKQSDISSITGLSESNISTKVSRIKKIISSVFRRMDNE